MPILLGAFISLDGTDFSAQLRSLDMPLNFDAIEATAMGADNAEDMEFGLGDNTISATFKANYGTGSIEEKLANIDKLSSGGTTVVIRRKASAAAVDNPQYTLPAIMENYDPLNGEIGVLHEISVTFRPTGNLVIATS